MKKWLIPLAALAVIIAATTVGVFALTGDDEPSGAGIARLVTIGPMCPVMREDVPCPDQPFQATIVVQDEDGVEVTRVESGEDGRFQVYLAPGRYILVPQLPNPGVPPSAEEQSIEVRAGAFTEATIQYDSGIR